MNDKFKGVTRYTLPDTLTDKETRKKYTVSAFLGTGEVYGYSNTRSFDTLILPDTMSVIGNPFASFDSLRNISVSDTHPTLAVIDNALVNKETQTLLAYPRARGGSFAVPEGIKEIGDLAFGRSKLTSVTIPDTVVRMGANPFCSSQIRTVSVEENHPALAVYDGAVYSKTERRLISFLDTSSSVPVIIPEGITAIGDYAFNNARISSVVMPSTMREIGAYAFASCYYIHEMNLPDGLEKIGPYAFKYVKELTELTVPDSLTEIGEGAFIWMEALKKIHIPAQVAVIPENMCYGCYALEEVTLSDGLKTISKSAFYNTSLRTIQFPETLESIGKDAFGSSGITALTLPDSVTNLEKSAFSFMKNLEEVKLSDGIKVLPEQLFIGCEKLKRVILPEGVEEIKSGVFSSCPKLKEVYIPKTVKKLSSLDNVCAIVEENSYAHSYLKDRGDSFILTKDYTDDLPIPEQAASSGPSWLQPETPKLTECPDCGYQFPEDYDFKFCPGCGKQL